MLCPSVPIDKNKQGGRNYDASKLTDFKKIGTISKTDTSKVAGINNNRNPQTDTDEQRRASVLIAGLRTIPRAYCPVCPTVATRSNLSVIQNILQNTPSGKITLTLMTYYPPDGTTPFPGILTASAEYGVNWYYVYLNCDPTWFGTSPGSFWCNGPDTNKIYEGPTQSASKFTFVGLSSFATSYPVGSNKFWIITNDGRSYYPTSTEVAIIGSTSTISVQQVDYVTTTGTTRRPDTRAGTFIHDAFLPGNVWNNKTSAILDIPAYYV